MADHRQYGSVEKQCQQGYHQAHVGCGHSRSLIKNDGDSTDEQDSPNEISPEERKRNPVRRQFGEGNTGRELGVEKVFNAVEDQWNADAEACDGYQSLRATLVVLKHHESGESKSATPKGGLS